MGCAGYSNLDINDMKQTILIIGEYSGFGSNLKSGFEALGCRVVQYVTRYSWKAIPFEGEGIEIDTRNLRWMGRAIPQSWRLRHLLSPLRLIHWINSYKGCFDTILITNYLFLTDRQIDRTALFRIADLPALLKPGGRIYLSALSDDYAYMTYGSRMRFWMHDGLDISRHFFLRNGTERIFRKLMPHIHGVIPAMYCYYESYRQLLLETERGRDPLLKTPFRLYPSLPLPIDTERISERMPDIGQRLVIFHGLNREEHKGTFFIREAMERIARRYPDQVEIVIAGRMPLTEYLTVVARSHIIVDQCKSYCYGMAALYGMAQGKVVLSGCEPETLADFALEEIPVVPIRPDVSQIERELEKLIRDPERIERLGVASRRFVESFHSKKKVAQRYLDLFNAK